MMDHACVLRAAALATLVGLLVACATPPATVKDERLLIAPGADAGFLVGSIGRKAKGKGKSIASKNELRIRNVETGAKLELSHSGDGMFISPTDIEEGANKASLYRVPLPPGQYEIYKAYFFFNNGTLIESYENSENFSYLFKVEAGKEVYLGEAIASSITGKNILGLPLTVGYRFDFADRRQRDFDLLKARYPDFNAGNTSVFIPLKSITIDRDDLIIVPAESAASVPAAGAAP